MSGRTPQAIFAEHVETERRRRWGDISQVERDRCVIHDQALLEELIELEDAGVVEAADMMRRWADEVSSEPAG